MSNHTIATAVAEGAGPSGRRPDSISAGRIGIYLFLIIAVVFFTLPLYVLVVSSLKTMDEIRESSSLALPAIPQFRNWWEAWATACTGQTCNGISPGFWNSLKVLIPSMTLTLAIASVSGYALTFWRVSWANKVFAGLLLGAFVPYQVFIFPLIRIFTTMGISSSLTAVTLVHTAFQLPIITLIFRNYYSGFPIEIFRAGRVDGAGFFQMFIRIMLPMSGPIMVVAVILLSTHIWNDFIVGLVFAGRTNQPMTVQINAMIATDTGAHSYNIEMAAVLLTSLVPLAVYFLSGRWFVRGIAAGAVKG